MAGKIAQRLTELGITLPEAASAMANYVPYVVSGRVIHIAGQVPRLNGTVAHIGCLGRDISVEEGYQAASNCGLSILAQTLAATGDLDLVTRIIKLNVFVRSDFAFTDQPKVANGASDLMVEVFGSIGRHARSAVGVVQLPFGVCVEIDAVVEFS
ncbi:MAG: RidA family protein [Alphaproteobacteria bacterium]|nr:RidA family protein [Alphaproteobacteria bacterium]